MTPTRIGTEIRDAHSINGTFVNGIRVGSAILSDGDIVTIGNVDLAFTGGTLARHTQVATRAGRLEVNAVNFSINGNGLLENISLTARPGTLTAVIGGSGPARPRCRGSSPATPAPALARSPSRATTSTPTTRPCAAGSGWSPRTTSCTESSRSTRPSVMPPSFGCHPTPAKRTAPRSSPVCSTNWGSPSTPTPESTSCPAASASVRRWHSSCSPDHRY
ncbi:FHA domain protein [Mycobacterium ulcerans str. Harvey]|uniref:FHA domain protein n=1 Tax=Mycobacterium ulcerans str. Harvey TaxID=1299332 RepID=A0ABN0R2P3_MYCUL|nr:FHA domain protein [Mycobacterium ulcerans str. Harvey]